MTDVPPAYVPGFEGQGDYEIPTSEGPTNGDPGGPLSTAPEPTSSTTAPTGDYSDIIMRLLLRGGR